MHAAKSRQQSMETCSALDRMIAGNSDPFRICTRNTFCTEVTCLKNITPAMNITVQITITILPCERAPIHIRVIGSLSNYITPLINMTITESVGLTPSLRVPVIAKFTLTQITTGINLGVSNLNMSHC